jgi:hypothetical protein
MSRFCSLRSLPAWLVMLAMVASCSTADRLSGPEAAGPELLLDSGDGLLGANLGAGLLACPPQPPAQAEEEIGPEGGILQIGPHRLIVPEGALDRPVLISAMSDSDSVVSVRFAPEGLSFARPARLTLSYAHCPLLPSLLPKRIAYTTDALELLQLLISADDLLDRQVSANLDHFSRYAVAW